MSPPASERSKDSAPIIAYAKIFPPIGIARVGDSLDDNGFFYGPEFSSVAEKCEEKDPEFHYRDAAGRVKRQVARFRVLGFDSNGKFVREITARDANIKWRARLGNRKAAWFRFTGTETALAAFSGERPTDAAEIRNPGSGSLQKKTDGKMGAFYQYSADRIAAGLMISPPEVAISGCSQKTVPGNGQQFEFRGTFKGKREVYLGELRTDDEGRLLVFGGRGVSDAVNEKGESIRDLRWIQNYANNNDWVDDTSDGYVEANVTLKGADKPLKMRGAAWVIVAPPDFAPHTPNVVTLCDVLEEVLLNHPSLKPKELPAPPDPDLPDYERDIRPILRRISGYRWVNELALRGHGFQKPGDFETLLDGSIADPDHPDGIRLRKHIFELIRKPIYLRPEIDRALSESDGAIALQQANATYMPPLSGDEGNRVAGDSSTWLTVTHLQYRRLKAWSESRFVAGEKVKARKSPAAGSEARRDDPAFDLVRTTLEACVGGAFYPGIEITGIARHPALYEEAFRINGSVFEPGDITKYMACPWQADFYECQFVWWPAQRPDDVITNEDFEEIFDNFEEETMGDFEKKFEKVLFNRRRWDRGLDEPRPSGEFLRSLLLPKPAPKMSVKEYVHDRIKYISNKVFGSVNPVRDFEKVSEDERPKYPDRLPSPWRLQFLAQEIFDQYSGRYFHLVAPDAQESLEAASDKVKVSIAKLRTIRNSWEALRLKDEKLALNLVATYAKSVSASISAYVERVLSEYPHGKESAQKFVDGMLATLLDGVSEIEKHHPEDFGEKSDVFRMLRGIEMLSIALDILYRSNSERSGDMGMVEGWRKLGFVVETTREIKDREGRQNKITVVVEKERHRYDGRSYRDLFYYLLNTEKYPQIVPYAKVIAQTFLKRAEGFTNELGLSDPTHPESFVPFSQANYDAKLEEIYEGLRAQAKEYQPWLDPRNRADRIRRILDSAPFNQVDGAWLRFAANAGPADEIRELLFAVWSDETGNGDPALHHGNLFTALLNELGFWPPPISSREYADWPLIPDASYVSPVFQLAISQHSEEFYPELLGMTLFLEWEVLSLVPAVKLLDYLGLNSHFWQMHVGIDNATEGHGYAAKRAIRLYLDKILREAGGEEAVQHHWRRIWNGFVAFALADYQVYGNKDQDDATLARKYPGTPADAVKQVMMRKRHYGSLNHSNKKLGEFRINDLFDDPDTFLSELATSPWLTPGDPAKSRFINHLTTFQGPMYKIFDAADLQTWRNWIEWLGKDGDTVAPKNYIDKADAMLLLLTELREQALSSTAHPRYKLETQHGNSNKAKKGSQKLSVAALFAERDLTKLMHALRNEDNGWIVRGRPEDSPIAVDLARGATAMGLALDQRFPAIADQIGRKILVDWILAGCPIPGERKQELEQLPFRPPPRIRQLIVQEYGMGAVH